MLVETETDDPIVWNFLCEEDYQPTREIWFNREYILIV